MIGCESQYLLPKIEVFHISDWNEGGIHENLFTWLFSNTKLNVTKKAEKVDGKIGSYV